MSTDQFGAREMEVGIPFILYVGEAMEVRHGGIWKPGLYLVSRALKHDIDDAHGRQAVATHMNSDKIWRDNGIGILLSNRWGPLQRVLR